MGIEYRGSGDGHGKNAIEMDGKEIFPLGTPVYVMAHLFIPLLFLYCPVMNYAQMPQNTLFRNSS